MKRRDIWLVGAVLLLAGLLLLMGQLNKPQGPERAAASLVFDADTAMALAALPEEAESYLRVKQGKAYYPLVPLSGEMEITLRQEGGRENIVHTGLNSVRMHSANCPGKDCVKMGEMTLMNIEFRVNQRWITCLPHEISLELLPREEALRLMGGTQ